MDDIVQRLMTYYAAVIRYRWYAVAVAVTVCVLGWTAIALLPYKYAATARIYVDTKTILQPLLKGVAVDRDVNQEISAMQESLLSRPNLEHVLRQTGLDTLPNAAPPDGKQREGLIINLRNAINVYADAPNIFAIDVVHRDPKIAAGIAQALVDILVESSVGLGREDMDQAGRFLDAQIVDYEAKLEQAEGRAASFKQENLAFLPSSGSFQAGLDAAVQRERSFAAELRDAQTDLSVARAELVVTPPTIEPGMAADYQSGSPLTSMRTRLAEMLTRLTEKHPDVIALRRKIEEAELTGTADAELETGAPPTISFAPFAVPNPAFATLKLRVIDKEAEVTKLQEKLRLARQEVQELESRAYQVPQVEAQMAKLNRDYAVLKSQYEQLLSRREQARVSRDRDEHDDEQFRVVDPPRVPALPKGPPRRLLLTAMLPIACAAGIGIAIALSLLRSAYVSPRQLGADFDVPVIGSISFVRTPPVRRRNRLEVAGLVLLSITLLTTYGVLMTLEQRMGLNKIVRGTVAASAAQPAFVAAWAQPGPVFSGQDRADDGT